MSVPTLAEVPGMGRQANPADMSHPSMPRDLGSALPPITWKANGPAELVHCQAQNMRDYQSFCNKALYLQTRSGEINSLSSHGKFSPKTQQQKVTSARPVASSPLDSAATPPPSQSGLFHRGKEEAGSGSAASDAAGKSAREGEAYYGQAARLASSWHDDLGARINLYRAQSQKAGAGQDQARSLAQPVNPPRSLAPFYAQSGMHSKGDVLRLGPRILNNLGQAERADKDFAEKWKKAGDEAEEASGLLARMAGSLGRRAGEIDSLRSEPGSALLTPGKNDSAPFGPAMREEEARQEKHDSDIASGSTRKGISNAEEEGNGDADGSRRALAEKGSSPPDPAAAGREQPKSAAKASLKDRLAAALKPKPEAAFSGKDLAPLRGGKEGREPGSFDEVVNGAIRSAETSADSRPAAGSRGEFTLGAAETNAALRALTGSLAEEGKARSPASEGSTLASLGQTDISLFWRVRLAHQRCQKENCVTWKKASP